MFIYTLNGDRLIGCPARSAAAIYRRWVLGNQTTGSGGAAWTRKGPLREREGYPPWMLRTPLWVVHGDDDRNSPTQAVGPMEAFKASMANGSAANGQPEVGWELGYHYYNW